MLGVVTLVPRGGVYAEKQRNIPNKYKNDFIIWSNQLPCFYHPIKTLKTELFA